MEKQKQASLQVYSTGENFDLAQRIAKSLATSNLVPKEYQGNIPNTLIALEMASRIGASPLMVMQHLNIIHGRPSWSSTFIISAINSCGRFNPLQFRLEGKGNTLSCIAHTKDKDGNLLEGPAVTMEMAKAEGWLDKNGSKWKTMPELMIRYRAAAFWGRLYAPEITMGMQSAEEVIDIVANEISDVIKDDFENEEPVKVIEATGKTETPITEELFPTEETK